YIGLPSGFLYAGSSNVVSSLWTVDELPTAFLLIKFIQNLKAKENISVALALNQAQLWLRDATKEELQLWTKGLNLDSTWSEEVDDLLAGMKPQEKHFQSPYYWAAFTAVGL
ncbi:MAG: CHAT domain-containing protein, partial [Spirulinaceae cyanobacterium]